MRTGVLVVLAMSLSMIFAVVDKDLETIQVGVKVADQVQAQATVADQAKAQVEAKATETATAAETSEKVHWTSETPEDKDGETVEANTVEAKVAETPEAKTPSATEHLVESKTEATATATSESKIWDDGKPEKAEPPCKAENWKDHNMGKCTKGVQNTKWNDNAKFGPKDCWGHGKTKKVAEETKYWNRNCVKRKGSKKHSSMKSHKAGAKNTKLVSHHKHCHAGCPSCERTPDGFLKGLPEAAKDQEEKHTPNLRGAKAEDVEDSNEDKNDDEDEVKESDEDMGNDDEDKEEDSDEDKDEDSDEDKDDEEMGDEENVEEDEDEDDEDNEEEEEDF